MMLPEIYFLISQIIVQKNAFMNAYFEIQVLNFLLHHIFKGNFFFFLSLFCFYYFFKIDKAIFVTVFLIILMIQPLLIHCFVIKIVIKLAVIKRLMTGNVKNVEVQMEIMEINI